MRISGLANVSTGSLPKPGLAAIDALFDGGDPRRPLDCHGIPVVPNPYGFLAHSGMAVEDDKPAEISHAFWAILAKAEHQGCDWALFDRDEPV